MMVSLPLRGSITLATGVALLLGALSVAAAREPGALVEGPLTRYDFTEEGVEIRHGPVVELIRVPPRTLQEGETIFLQGRVAARNSSTRNIGQVAEIGCLGTPEDGHPGEVQASRNHEGSDFPYPVPGQLHVLVDYTFTAPADGTYTCRLNTTAWTDADPDLHYLVIVPYETRLLVSDEVQPGAHNWVTKECDSQGTSPTCLYTGAAGYRDTTYVFYSDFDEPYVWTADPSAVRVEARGVLQLTNCSQNTGSCIDEVDQYGTRSWSTVRVRLELIQLDAENVACQVFSTPAQTYTISNDAHHYAITHVLPPVTPNPACARDFMLRFYVNHGSGNPVKIDGVSNDIVQTNGSVFNLFD